jgi:hypothetical protein
MTEHLRDRFAMAALTGLLASPGTDERFVRLSDRSAAEKCYRLADAMLAARAREGGEG